MKRHSEGLMILGSALIVYGLVSLLFEVFNSSYATLAMGVWTFLNPPFAFVVTSGIAGMRTISLLFDFSTPGMATATLTYWLYPTMMIILGIVAYPSGKRK